MVGYLEGLKGKIIIWIDWPNSFESSCHDRGAYEVSQQIFQFSRKNISVLSFLALFKEKMRKGQSVKENSAILTIISMYLPILVIVRYRYFSKNKVLAYFLHLSFPEFVP